MNALKKNLFVLMFLCLTAAGLFAETGNEVDLSITIRTLDDAAKTGRGIPVEGTPVILNGTVTSRSVISSGSEPFEGQLTLSSGEWMNSDEILVSKCIVILKGQQFSDTIPLRRSRTVNPQEISLNSELLVYGQFIGWADTEVGPMAVIQAYGVRKLN